MKTSAKKKLFKTLREAKDFKLVQWESGRCDALFIGQFEPYCTRIEKWLLRYCDEHVTQHQKDNVAELLSLSEANFILKMDEYLTIAPPAFKKGDEIFVVGTGGIGKIIDMYGDDGCWEYRTDVDGMQCASELLPVAKLENTKIIYCNYNVVCIIFPKNQNLTSVESLKDCEIRVAYKEFSAKLENNVVKVERDDWNFSDFDTAKIVGRKSESCAITKDHLTFLKSNGFVIIDLC